MHRPILPWTGSSGGSAFPSSLFSINVASQADAYVIRLEGELDLCECHRLADALAEAEASQASRVLLDLDELTFIDAAGLQALLTACRRSVRNGDRLRVTRGSGTVAEMFRLTAFDTTLPFAPAGPDPNGARASDQIH